VTYQLCTLKEGGEQITEVRHSVKHKSSLVIQFKARNLMCCSHGKIAGSNLARTMNVSQPLSALVEALRYVCPQMKEWYCVLVRKWT
jgi:hypothetical protein